MHTLTAEKMHIPIIIENALCNTGQPRQYNVSLAFWLPEVLEVETNAQEMCAEKQKIFYKGQD